MEMYGVRLDDLVLECCAVHMDIISRIVQEPVSQRFTKALRLVNRSSEISLVFRDETILSTEKSQFLIDISCNSKRASLKITVPSMPSSEPINSPMALSIQQQHIRLFDSVQCSDKHFLTSGTSISWREEAATAMDKINNDLLQIFSRFERLKQIIFISSS